MILEMLEKVRAHLPLKVVEANWDSEGLKLSGEGWAFFTTEPWRIFTNARMMVGSGEDDQTILSAVKLLQDEVIVQADHQGKKIACDPVFVFSNQCILEVFSTDGFEPWIFSFPNGETTYVGSPQDPKCIDRVER